MRLAALILDNADELALIDFLDAGKLITDTTTIDVPGSASILQQYAETADKSYGKITPTGTGDLALISREPLAVVAAVVPWNSPRDGDLKARADAGGRELGGAQARRGITAVGSEFSTQSNRWHPDTAKPTHVH